MRNPLRSIADAVKRWTSEPNVSESDDPHVGQKSADEPGFGRPTGAEKRRERGEPGPADEDR